MLRIWWPVISIGIISILAFFAVYLDLPQVTPFLGFCGTAVIALAQSFLKLETEQQSKYLEGIAKQQVDADKKLITVEHQTNGLMQLAKEQGKLDEINKTTVAARIAEQKILDTAAEVKRKLEK